MILALVVALRHYCFGCGVSSGYWYVHACYHVSTSTRLNAILKYSVKVRFQTPEHATKYRNTFHAFFTILRQEGIQGLYRGITSPLVIL